MNRISSIVPLAVAGCLATAPATPVAADLVVLAGGSFLKVAAYEVSGKKVKLELAAGGLMTLPLSRVERIVDDEILPDPDPLPEEISAQVGVPIRFAGDQGVPDSPYGELIFEAARRHGLNPVFVSAVVRAESAYDVRAVSSKGARGLMQLMPATAERFGLRPGEVFEPAKNLDAGSRYLKWLAERFSDDLPRILAAYNAGEGTVDRYGGVPPYRETRNYIRRIYRFLGLPPSGLAL